MAAPHVTGLVALMLAEEQEPDLRAGPRPPAAFRADRRHPCRRGAAGLSTPAPDIRANHLWGSGKVNAASRAGRDAALGAGRRWRAEAAASPAATSRTTGATPRTTIVSRLGEWRDALRPAAGPDALRRPGQRARRRGPAARQPQPAGRRGLAAPRRTAAGAPPAVRPPPHADRCCPRPSRAATSPTCSIASCRCSTASAARA